MYYKEGNLKRINVRKGDVCQRGEKGR